MKMMKLGDKAKIKVRDGFDIEVEHLQGKKYNITPIHLHGQNQISFGSRCLVLNLK